MKSKKENFDLSKLSLASDMEMVKTQEGTQVIEKVIKQIHEKPKEEQKTSIPSGFKRVVVDIPSNLYKSMKFHLAEDEISMRDYVANLIKKEDERRK